LTLSAVARSPIDLSFMLVKEDRRVPFPALAEERRLFMALFLGSSLVMMTIDDDDE
jgi:hypothetical protein